MLPVTSSTHHTIPQGNRADWASWCPDYERNTDKPTLTAIARELKKDLFGPDKHTRDSLIDGLVRNQNNPLRDYLIVKCVMKAFNSRRPERKVLACQHMHRIVSLMKNRKHLIKLMPLVAYHCQQKFMELGAEAQRRANRPMEEQPLAAHFARLSDLELWFGYHYARDNIRFLTEEHRSNLRMTLMLNGFNFKKLLKAPDLDDIAAMLVKTEQKQALLQCKFIAFDLLERTTITTQSQIPEPEPQQPQLHDNNNPLHVPTNAPLQEQLSSEVPDRRPPTLPDNNNPNFFSLSTLRKARKRPLSESTNEHEPTSHQPKRQRTNTGDEPRDSISLQDLGSDSEKSTGTTRKKPKLWNKNRPEEYRDDSSTHSDKSKN